MSIHDYGKNHSFDYTLKVMSLLFNTVSRFVIAFQDEMVGWQHRLDGHEFEQASGVGDGSLRCCSS